MNSKSDWKLSDLMGSKGWHQWHNISSGSKAGGQSLAVYPRAQYQRVMFNTFVTDGGGVTQRCTLSKLAGGADRPKRVVLMSRGTLTEELSNGTLQKFSKGKFSDPGEEQLQALVCGRVQSAEKKVQ